MPHTQDHDRVLRYPPVRGMAHEVFFWDHDHPEGGNDDSKSKVNPPEAQKAARLALYMVQQGYAAGEVTILTPYVGQLRLIIRELSKLMDVVVGDLDAEQLADLVSLQGRHELRKLVLEQRTQRVQAGLHWAQHVMQQDHARLDKLCYVLRAVNNRAFWIVCWQYSLHYPLASLSICCVIKHLLIPALHHAIWHSQKAPTYAAVSLLQQSIVVN